MPKAAGCEKLFVEKSSGAQRDRPELSAALDYLRAGDSLVVWKLVIWPKSPKLIVI